MKIINRQVSNFKQKGVTLIELILVLGIISYITILGFEQKRLEFEQAKARDVGRQLNIYNGAVRAWLSDNAGATNRVEEGSSWLKPVSCGGSSSIEYLPCNFPAASAALPIKFGNLALRSIVKTTGSAPNQITTITTTTSPFTLGANEVRGDLSGLAAITAASGFTANNTPTMLATQDSYSSSPGTAIVTMVASNNASTDAWLRTDGSNFMNNTIRFDPDISEENRQIHNISRLQNIASKTLFIGNSAGASVGYSVIVDADQAVYGKLVVENQRNLASGIELTRGNIVANAGSVHASANIEAGNNLIGKRFVDKDNNTLYIDPNNTSAINNLSTQGDINSNGHIKSKEKIEAPVFYDSDNIAYKVDPSGNSRLTDLQVYQELHVGGQITAHNHVLLNKSVTKGGSCSTNGLIARDAKGMILSCASGIWSHPEGVEGKYTHLGLHYGTTTFNSGTRPILVQVIGGNDLNCGSDWSNRFNLRAIVNGSQVAGTANNNNSYAKSGYMSFGVPSNSSYTILSDPYACGAGRYSVSVFTL